MYSYNVTGYEIYKLTYLCFTVSITTIFSVQNYTEYFLKNSIFGYCSLWKTRQ